MAEFPTKRIINLGEQSEPQSGDYIVTDNQTNGTKKTPASALAKAADLTAEQTARQQADTELESTLNDCAKLPESTVDVEFTENVGIIRTNLSVYSEGSSYRGRYTSIPVNSGETYYISCYSLNNNYPGCFGVAEGGTSAVTPFLLGGSAQAYNDAEVTIPEGISTIYINANYPDVLGVKKLGRMTQTEFEQRFSKLEEVTSPAMYATINSNNTLRFKKKSLLSKKDLCITMGHNSIGNNLYSFLDMYDKSNVGALSADFTPESGANTLGMSQSDWISPYVVKAVSNADGDHPAADYFTGGNHRSNNSSSGAGKTATETALKILIDGVEPTIDKVYPCSFIDVFVTNLINGYNTSKDDGTGRNIIQEDIHFHITTEKVEIERVITPLETVVVQRCYGLQIYYPSSTVSFIGGEDRIPFAVNANKLSGNKNTRDVIATSAFEIRSGVYPTDIGSFGFNDSAFSYFTSGNKVYSNVIYNNATEFSTGEKYYCNGYYIFN